MPKGTYLSVKKIKPLALAVVELPYTSLKASERQQAVGQSVIQFGGPPR